MGSLSGENASVSQRRRTGATGCALFDCPIKGEEIYREGQHIDAVFNIITGVVKAYKTAPDGSKHVTAFLFPGDMFGLSEEGKYTNSTEALTPLDLYRLPMPALRSRLAKDADLEFHVICKLLHELRETQRHAFLLTRKRALSKVAMFLQLLENLEVARGMHGRDISSDERVGYW